MTPDTEPVALPVNCPVCGRGVWLEVAGWNEPPYQQSTWLCPYLDCQKINGITMAGKIGRVTAHYGPSISPLL